MVLKFGVVVGFVVVGISRLKGFSNRSVPDGAWGRRPADQLIFVAADRKSFETLRLRRRAVFFV